MAVRVTVMCVAVFSKLKVVPVIGDQDRRGRGSREVGSPLWVHRNVCWDRLQDTSTSSTTCERKDGIKCSNGCSSKLFLPDLESLFDEIKMGFSASI